MAPHPDKSPTVFATDILTKALTMGPDQILSLIHTIAVPMLESGTWSLTEVKRLQKQTFEVVKIRNHLAIMLDRLDVADPRQFALFDDVRPDDFT